MRRSGLLVWQILQKLREMAVEGVSTMDLEVTAEKMMADAGAKPAFKGYYVPAAGVADPAKAEGDGGGGSLYHGPRSYRREDDGRRRGEARIQGLLCAGGR